MKGSVDWRERGNSWDRHSLYVSSYSYSAGSGSGESTLAHSLCSLWSLSTSVRDTAEEVIVEGGVMEGGIFGSPGSPMPVSGKGSDVDEGGYILITSRSSWEAKCGIVVTMEVLYCPSYVDGMSKYLSDWRLSFNTMVYNVPRTHFRFFGDIMNATW